MKILANHRSNCTYKRRDGERTTMYNVGIYKMEHEAHHTNILILYHSSNEMEEPILVFKHYY